MYPWEEKNFPYTLVLGQTKSKNAPYRNYSTKSGIFFIVFQQDTFNFPSFFHGFC